MFKSLNKGISTPLGILIIILVATIAGGGILAWQYWWLPKEEANDVACTMEAKVCPDGSAVGRTGPNCEFTECPAAKADETADWQTYRNEQYGFEMKYPNNWRFSFLNPGRQTDVSLEERSIDVEFFPFPESSTSYPSTPPGAALGGIITVFVSPIEHTVYCPVKQGDESCINGEDRTIIVDGIKGIERKGITTKYCPPEGTEVEEIYLCNLNKFFRLDSVRQGESIFNQMLSTFKFLEGKTATSSPKEESCFKGDIEWAPYASLDRVIDESLKKIIIERFIKQAEDYGCDKDEMCYVESISFEGYKFDLNNDGVFEYAVLPEGINKYTVVLEGFMGCILRGASGNGPIDVYGLFNGSWKLIGELYGNLVAPVKNQTKGYLNLVTHGHGSAYSGTFSEYAWDGEKYVLIKNTEYGPDNPIPQEYEGIFQQE